MKEEVNVFSLFFDFCDNTAVVVTWCFLIVINAAALVVSLIALPFTDPIEPVAAAVAADPTATAETFTTAITGR